MTNLSAAEILERAWISFQLDVAAMRGAIGPLYQAAVDARRHHTFYEGNGPEGSAVVAIMRPTPDVRNGVPDVQSITNGGSYVARLVSVMTASVILIYYDAAIQKLARELGEPTGSEMQAGDAFATTGGTDPVKASTLIWAGANNVRHVDEWFATAKSYSAPQTRREIALRETQNRSMEPLAAVLGCQLPITDNAAFEVLHLLTEVSPTEGRFDRLELHLLRIGQDLVHRAGLINAPIGVTIAGQKPYAALTDAERARLMISDGTARAASSLPDTGRLESVRPIEPYPHS